MNKIKYIIKKFTLPSLYYILRVFPIKSNKIFISNFYGKGYGDIPKYIVNQILKEKKDYDIVWVVKKDTPKENFPKQIRFVTRNTIRCIYEQVTAKVWIDNCRKQFYERKRKKQYYIQTWHGGIPIKKIEMEIQSELPKEYILSAKNDSKMANLFLSNNKFLTNLYKKFFWYNGEILECGSPRNDILFGNNNEYYAKIVKNYYNISYENKLCLYAPTFRRNLSLKAYNIDFENLKLQLEKKFGGKWKILVRLHPNIAMLSKEFIKYNEDIINASSYEDMQELLVSADFMISDYSTAILDYGIAYKKGCLYASDIEEYKEDRGFHFKFEELPFYFATNNEELTKIIKDYDEKKSFDKMKYFYEKIQPFEDGNSAKIVVEKLNEIIK